MKKVRIIVGIVALVLAGFWLYEMDYSNLGWELNRSPYIGLLTSGCILLSQLFEHCKLNEKKKNSK